MKRLVLAFLDRFWPVNRWECGGCKKVWEQRRKPGYSANGIPSFAFGFSRIHDIKFTPEPGLVAWKKCGPIRYRGTRVRPEAA